MNEIKKINKIKNLLDAILKETSENIIFQELRQRIKQSLTIANNLENKIENKEKKKKTNQNKKHSFSNSLDPKTTLKLLDDQINQQRQELDKLEKKNSQEEDIRTFFN